MTRLVTFAGWKKARRVRHVVVLVLMLSGVLGCNEEPATAPSPPSQVTDVHTVQPPSRPKSRVGPELPIHLDAVFDAIPSDTPYYWVSIADSNRRELSVNLDDWSNLYESFANAIQDTLRREEVPFGKLLSGFLDALRGRFDAEGLAELGMLPTPKFALYGIGAFPALRFELADAKRFDALLDRIEAETAQTSESLEIDEWTFRVFRADGWSLAVVITPNEASMMLAPNVVLADLLPILVGRERRVDSIGDTDELQALTERMDGGASAMSFFSIDLLGLASAIAGVDKKGLVAQTLDQWGVPILSADCTKDFLRLAKIVPRIYYLAFDARGKQSGRFFIDFGKDALELNLLKLQRLTEKRQKGWAEPPIAFLNAFPQLVETKRVLEAIESKLRDVPLKCEPLLPLNALAELTPSEFLVAIPPVRGFSVLIQDWRLTPLGLSELRASVALHTLKPEVQLEKLFPELPQKPQRGVPLSSFGVTLPLLGGFTYQLENDLLLFASDGKNLDALKASLTPMKEGVAPFVEVGFDYGEVLKGFGSLSSTVQSELIELQERFAHFGMFTVSLSFTESGAEITYEMVVN